MDAISMRRHRSHVAADGWLRLFQKRPVVVLGVLAALVFTGRALAVDRAPRLEQVASSVAGRPTEVRCPTLVEWQSTWSAGGAWAYTDLDEDWIVLHPALCAGALDVSERSLPTAQRAMGALVLLHESFHVRRWKYRRNEGRVECAAIRAFKAGAQALGASKEEAEVLYAYALALHLRTVQLFPEYRVACRLPLWQPPFMPLTGTDSSRGR
jgi:hypothetical protein